MPKPTRLFRSHNYTYNISEDLRQEDGKEIAITMNTERYVLTVYPSGMCEMEYPKRSKESHIEDQVQKLWDFGFMQKY